MPFMMLCFTLPALPGEEGVGGPGSLMSHLLSPPLALCVSNHERAHPTLNLLPLLLSPFCDPCASNQERAHPQAQPAALPDVTSL